MDTFGALGKNIVKMGTWMSLPDGTLFGTQQATLNELGVIRSQLDDGRPVVLGLVRKQTSDTLEIWNNHQVLAYGYSESPTGDITMNIYDPNRPNNNDITIEATRVVVGAIFNPSPPSIAPVFGLSCKQMENGVESINEPVRGFFSMDYVPVIPSPGL